MRCQKKWAHFFNAIGDDHRQKILLLLRKNGEMNVGAIDKAIGISQPTVSHHLKILHQAEIVKSTKKGKEVFYSLLNKNIKQCCGGFLERMSRHHKR